ncbi:hypothetical protein BGZ76_000402 [Entomortierella beljakovae]|nr:hypothetical protein BGZ76_000402 [Entomortierella beljakovae]
MTVSGYGYQEFQSGPDTFEVRVIPGTPQTQGRSFVMWDDIQDVFPLACRLQCGRRIVSFMVDVNGVRILPLRIEHQPGSAIQVIMTRESSLNKPPVPPRRRSPPSIQSLPQQMVPTSPSMTTYHSLPPSNLKPTRPAPPTPPSIPALSSLPLKFPTTTRSSSPSTPLTPLSPLPPPSPRGNAKYGSYIATFTLANIDDDEEDDDSTKRDSLLSTRTLSQEAKTHYRSSVYLYESFLQSMQLGQSAQADLVCDDFREQFLTLEAEMSRNQNLQTQMYGMQQTMQELQQQASERLADIQDKVQEILVQNYDVYDYPIPRLFIILPSDRLKWDSVNIFENKFRLFFLCECGEHTRGNQGNKISHHIHLPEHTGYDIENPAEFFKYFGNHVMTLLNMLKYGVAVDGYTTQALIPTNPRLSSEGLHLEQPEDFINSLERGVERALEFLECMSIKGQLTPPPPKARTSVQLKPTTGRMDISEMKRLGAYLVIEDSKQVLGDLHRVVTPNGYAKWICGDHYREMHSSQAMKELSEATRMNYGSFNEHFGRANVVLTTSSAASSFYKLAERCKFIQELRIELSFDVSIGDLKNLRDSLLKTGIAFVDLKCPGTPAPTDILSRSKKRPDPIWEMMGNPKLQSFTLNDFTGFFSKVTVQVRSSRLRSLKITEKIEWKKDYVRVLELIAKSPLLKELRLTSTDIEEAFMAIKKVNMYEACALDHLTLDGGESNGLQARFEGGLPSSIDLVVPDLSGSFLQETQILRTLSLRTGPHTRLDIEPHLLIGIMRRNPNLAKLTVQCPCSEFIFWHKVVSNSFDSHSKLKSLRLYNGRNQLLINNLQDDNSIELELLSLNSSTGRDGLDALLKVYAPRLTKLKIDTEILKSMFDVVFPGRPTMLKHLDILSSALTMDMLYDLRLVLRRSDSIGNLLITLDERPDGSEKSKDLADLVSEFRDEWKKITVKESDIGAWKDTLTKYGYNVPFNVLAVVVNTRSDYIVLGNIGMIGKGKA